ncbi:MAG: AsmA family protein, partial [Nitrospirales bacterium]
MRSRARNLWLIGVLVIVLLAGLGYALFPFLIDEEQYRRPLEKGASFALGRGVTIEGPISLSLSFHPTLALEHVRIANPSWASRPDLLHATRLEAQLSFLALLRREVVIDKIFVDGVDLLLEEGPKQLNNWTFGSPPEPSASPQLKSGFSATMSEESFATVQRITIAYQPYMASGPESSLTIIEGSVSPGDDRTRKFSVRGMFRDTPFTVELIGEKVVDLLDLSHPWPIDGLITAANTSLKINGRLMGPLTALSLELNGELRGERLNDLDPLFDANLPSYGPYELITSLSLSENSLRLADSRLKVGQTDLSGLFIMDFKEDRTHYYSRLTGETLQTKDFQSSEPENNPAHTSPPSPESFAKHIGMEAIDIDLELAVNTFLVDQQNFGRIALSAKLEEGLLRVTPFQAETFGGVITGSFELDGNHPAPRATLEVTAQDWNYGQALQALDVTSEIAGSTDLNITINGQGATLQEFLDHTTLSINAGPSSLMFGNEKNSDKMVVGISQATVKASKGGAIKARVKGAFMEKPIDVALVTGSLTQLTTPDKPWPISLLARSEDASLTIKGGLKSEAEGMRVALAVSLKGQRLDRLDPDLPPSGPYVFRAKLLNSGSEIFLKDLKGRVGQNDVTGSLSFNMEEDIPQLSAAFSSSYLDMADLSTPGDITIPVESLQDLGADFTWKVKRLIDENVKLGDLTVEGTLKNGRLAFTTLQGNFFDRKHTYAEFQGELTLDTTAAIPTVSGKTAIQNLDYGHLLKRFGGNGQLVGVANLDANFSSKGNSLFTMLAQPNFKIATQDVRI